MSFPFWDTCFNECQCLSGRMIFDPPHVLGFGPGMQRVWKGVWRSYYDMM
jgi:hypothetical protein